MKHILILFFFLFNFSSFAQENGKVKCVLEQGENKYTLVSYSIKEYSNVASFLIMCSANEEHSSCATLPFLIKRDREDLFALTDPNSQNEYNIDWIKGTNKTTISYGVINTVVIRKNKGAAIKLSIKYGKDTLNYFGFCEGDLFHVGH